MRNSPFLLFATLLVAVLSSCSSAPLLKSQWQSSPVIVDGDASDWQRPLMYYDKDSKLSYSITNDSTKLYLCFQIYDIETQMKIIRAGLQLWIDTVGGKEQQIGVLYPVAGTMVPLARDDYARSTSAAPDFDPIGRLRKNFLRSPGEIELAGFKSPIGGMVPLHNAFGINVRINWDTMNNVMNYEAAIPFTTFYHPSIRPMDSLLTFGVQFTVNGIDHGKRGAGHESGESGGGGFPGGGATPGSPGSIGGGGYGGGMRGGAGGGRGGGHRGSEGQSGESGADLSHSETLKIRLRLASH